MSDEQIRALDSNFTRSGVFFVSEDVHSMLDCASTWDVGLTGTTASTPPRGPVGIPGVAVLREEFFGGLCFDRRTHRQAMVNSLGFEVLRALATRTARTSHQVTSALAGRFGAEAVEQALADLAATGVIAPGATSEGVTFVPARDLSKAYFQAPSIVEAELTYGCFRACRHCAYSATPQSRTSDELSADEWGELFRKLADVGVFVVQLTGGDPLFRPDSFDIVEAADKAGLSVYVRSDTVALTDENLDRLQDLDNLWHIGTSIDGADEQAHDWMRGKGAFDTLIDRMTRLAERDVPVAAGATLHRSNAPSVREIGRVAIDNGARWFDVGLLSPVGRGAALEAMVLDGEGVRRALDTYLGGVSDGVYRPSHGHYERRVGRESPFADIDPLIPVLPYVTEWPWSRLRVSPTGSTYTAGKLKGSDFAGGHNLLTCDVVDVWDTSPNLVKLRELGGGRIHSLDFRLLRTEHHFT